MQNVKYWPEREAAELAREGLPARWQPHSRVVEYGRGFAVQLHRSGPYLGAIDPNRHECPWCPLGLLK